MHFRELAPGDCNKKEGLLALMNTMWEYITPGNRGVNTTKMFYDGALLYGKDRGIDLKCRVLNIEAKKSLRPSILEMSSFIDNAMNADLPVAFLNLSNGTLKNLDNWHWVTITAYDSVKHTAIMCDQGSEHEIEMDTWIETTLLGGGLVVIEPDEEAAERISV